MDNKEKQYETNNGSTVESLLETLKSINSDANISSVDDVTIDGIIVLGVPESMEVFDFIKKISKHPYNSIIKFSSLDTIDKVAQV